MVHPLLAPFQSSFDKVWSSLAIFKGLGDTFMPAWLREVFSNSDKGSTSRLISFLLALAAVGWVTHIVLKTHALPDFSGLTLLVTSPYAAGKINETIQKRNGNGNDGTTHP